MSAKNGSCTTLIVFDDSDVGAAVRDCSIDETALSLTPLSDMALGQHQFKFWNRAPRASSFTQARWVSRVRRTRNRLRSLLSRDGTLEPGFVLWAEEWLTRYGFIALRAHYMVGEEGPWKIRNKRGKWVCYSQRLDAVSGVIERLLFGGERVTVPSYGPPCSWLVSALRRWALFRLRQRRWIIGPTPKFKLGAGQEILNACEDAGQGGLVFPEKFSELIVILGGLLYKDRERLLIPVWRSGQSRAPSTILEKAFLQVPDPVIRAGVKSVWSVLRRNFEALWDLTGDAERVLDALRPRAVLASESNSNGAVLLFAAARRAGVPRATFNHNCHASPSSAVGKEVITGMAIRRFYNRTVDVAYVWSPATIRLCQEIKAEGDTPELKSVSIYEKLASVERVKKKQFRLLHAGNFQGWRDYFPFVSETSHEYVKGIIDLAATVAETPELELIIRCRDKDECEASLLREVLDKSENISVSDASVPFEQALLGSDLLVCNFSTTVEQAVQMGIPVLLWGSADRFIQVEASRQAPTATSRAAVYAAGCKAELKRLLPTIALHHRDRRLQRDEIGQFAWSDRAPDLRTRMIELLGEQKGGTGDVMKSSDHAEVI